MRLSLRHWATRALRGSTAPPSWSGHPQSLLLLPSLLSLTGSLPPPTLPMPHTRRCSTLRDPRHHLCLPPSDSPHCAAAACLPPSVRSGSAPSVPLSSVFQRRGACVATDTHSTPPPSLSLSPLSLSALSLSLPPRSLRPPLRLRFGNPNREVLTTFLLPHSASRYLRRCCARARRAGAVALFQLRTVRASVRVGEKKKFFRLL